MIYEKLPVVLLSTLAVYEEGNINHVIARYVIDHIEDVKTMGIQEIANACHVGTGSISRFVRDIGLKNYAELKDLLHQDNFSYQRDEVIDVKKTASHIKEAITSVETSVDMKQIAKLAADIQAYENVYACGLLKAENAANNLVVDLCMMGKHIKTDITYAAQIHSILEAKEDDLLIIFSYTGSYFEYQDFRAKEKLLKAPKIWMIVGGTKEVPWFVDEVIRFDSKLDPYSHPYQLEYIESLIAAVYGGMK